MRAVPPTTSRLIVKRNGSSITGKIPKPTVLIDSREQDPLTFVRFKNWIAGERVGTMKTGDYTVMEMQDILCVERKSLTDLVSTLMHSRERFFRECERMTKYPHRALVIEASYEDVKSPYNYFDGVVAHPNGVSGTLDALEIKYGIPVIYTSQYKELAEEKVASFLSKHFTYWYLETNNMGRFLQDGDL